MLPSGDLRTVWVNEISNSRADKWGGRDISKMEGDFLAGIKRSVGFTVLAQLFFTILNMAAHFINASRCRNDAQRLRWHLGYQSASWLANRRATWRPLLSPLLFAMSGKGGTLIQSPPKEKLLRTIRPLTKVTIRKGISHEKVKGMKRVFILIILPG